ncbi:hypothetical protein ADH75_03470 [Flavonifractor plautii]|nr:hypothetical protein A4U99_13965 [Flavonifractor plautii]OXE48647.1 hypothetical protein ADH75_03470 [Flavonifractor plautii]
MEGDINRPPQRLSIKPLVEGFGGKDSVKGCPAGRFGAQPPLAAALGAEMNRQGSLKVNWPQAKRDRPGPFALDQVTF